MSLLLAILTAQATDLRFPAGDADYGSYYPTAYFDQGGSTDWACGGITYSGHKGSDFGVGSWDGMDAGREIVAAAAGTVLYTNDGEFDECSTGDCAGGGGYGNYVWLEHPDGTQTIYAHMKQWSVAVGSGSTVACGAYLGEVGSSGYSTGPHLHFEVRDSSGAQVDPFDGDCSSGPGLWVEQGSYASLPAPTCEDIAECAPVTTLTCGDVLSSRNDASGSTSEHLFYGCVEYSYTGPELALEVRSTLDETITLSLGGLSADLDLFALDDAACDASGCITASSEAESADESISFEATAGALTVVVIDGWEGAVSDFQLTVSCAGTWEEGDGGAGDGGSGDGGAGDGGSTDGGAQDGGDGGDGGLEGGDGGWSGDAGEEPAPGQSPGVRTELGVEGGCGCGGGSAFGWWPLALLGLRRRLSRRG